MKELDSKGTSKGRRSLQIGAMIAVLGSVACTSNVGQLRLILLRSPELADEPLAGVAVSVRVRVDGPDGRVGPVDFPLGARSGTLGDVPTGAGQVITVEGVGPEGNAVSRGRTAPLTIRAGDNTIELFIGRLERFSTTTASKSGGPDAGLAQRRAFHTATRLLDGHLLLVGGTAEPKWHPELGKATPPALKQPERLDGNSLRFARIDCAKIGACPRSGRIGHTATLLPSGNVLLAGGREGGAIGDVLKSVEVFSVETSSFLLGRELNTARVGHAAAFHDGVVALAGGRLDGGTQLTPLVESYDGGKLANLPQLTNARRDFALISLVDGTLFASGGFDQQGQPIASTELLPRQAVRWQAGPTLHVARAFHTATLLEGGQVLIVGGLIAGGKATASIERYQPAKKSLDQVGTLRLARWAHTTQKLRDGRILVVGGFGIGTKGSPTRTVEEITIVSGGLLNIKQPFSLHKPRAGHSATLLGSGWLLVAGGVTTLDQPSATAEVFIY